MLKLTLFIMPVRQYHISISSTKKTENDKAEEIQKLAKLGVESFEIRQKKDLEQDKQVGAA